MLAHLKIMTLLARFQMVMMITGILVPIFLICVGHTYVQVGQFCSLDGILNFIKIRIPLIIREWTVHPSSWQCTLGCFVKSTFQPKIKGIPSRIPPGLYNSDPKAFLLGTSLKGPST